MDALPELDPNGWQGTLLRASVQGTLSHAITMSLLAHNFDDAFFILLWTIFPDFEGRAPFICSAARVNKRGHVVVDMVLRGNPYVSKDCVIAPSLKSLEGNFRWLADRLKLSDQDRLELFAAVQNWVVADWRRDPTMDARDPDSLRLTVH